MNPRESTNKGNGTIIKIQWQDCLFKPNHLINHIKYNRSIYFSKKMTGLDQ